MARMKDHDESPVHAEPQRPAPSKLDDSGLQADYINFARVTSNPEELILDCGLNPHPTSPGDPAEQIRLSHRIVMNHFTAKRLLTTLAAALQRHEQIFGAMELDVRKRVRSNG